DGDTQSATTNIGGAFFFEDDAPSISVSGATLPTITVDESDFPIDVSASFSSLFNVLFGADGFKDSNNNDIEDLDAVTYQLGINAGSTGLVDTLTNEAVTLSLSGQVVIGSSANGGEVFRITVVDTNGFVTLNQSRAVVHPTAAHDESKGLLAANLITLTGTVVDGDGDTQSATTNIGGAFFFEDDAPSIAVSGATLPILEVHETNFAISDSTSFAALFTPVFGSDGSAATPVNYVLNVVNSASGLVDTLTGQAINLVKVGNNIIGQTATSLDTAFTVSINVNTGDITLKMDRALVHITNPDPDDDLILVNKISLSATAIDGDGDSATVTRDISGAFSFGDDGPAVSVSLDNVAPLLLIVNGGELGTNVTEDFSNYFSVTSDPGADGTGSLTPQYTLSITGGDGTDSGLDDHLNGQDILLYVTNSGSTIEGKTTGGQVDFTITVNSIGEITFDQIHRIEFPPGSTTTDTQTIANNLIKLTNNVILIDGDGDSVQDSEVVDITQSFVFENGSIPPQALDNSYNFAGSYGPINLMLILDYSGSMDSPPSGGGLESKLMILKNLVAGAGGLIDTYASFSSELNIIPVIFAWDRATATFLSSSGTAVNDAKNFIYNTIVDNSNTDYTLALNTALAALPSFPPSIPTVAYFISDGVPTASIIGTPVAAAWQAALSPIPGVIAIDSIVINLEGVGTVTTELEPIANPTDMPLVLETDTALSNLESLLLSSVQQISGNILTDGPVDILGSAASYTVQTFKQGLDVGIIGTPFITDLGATLTVQADGSFTYEAPLSVIQQGLTETFDYTLITDQLDTSSAQFEIIMSPVNENDIPPVAVNDIGSTFEDVVLNGSSVLTNDTDVDGGPKNVTLVNGQSIASPINLSSGAIVHMNSNGTYTYDPNDQFDALDVGEQAFDSFTYTINGGSTATVDITINGVANGSSLANPDNYVFSGEATGPINLLFLLDVSDSMNLSSDPNNQSSTSRLAILQQVVAGAGGLLDAYANASQDVNIILAPFNFPYFSTQTVPVVQTFATAYDHTAAINDAKTFINLLSARLGTNYNIGINDAISTFNLESFPAGQTISYFISDGEHETPTYGPINTTAWQNFLTAESVNSIVVNIGGLSNVQLDGLTNNGTGTVLSPAADLSNLSNILLSGTQQISGNILDNDTLTGTVTSLTLLSANQGGNPITFGIPFETALHAFLTLQTDGSFTYEAPLSLIQQGQSETFSYTHINNISGTSSSNFVIDMQPVVNTPTDIPPVAVNDIISVSANSGSSGLGLVNILANDSNPDGGPLRIISFNDVPVTNSIVTTYGTFIFTQHGWVEVDAQGNLTVYSPFYTTYGDASTTYLTAPDDYYMLNDGSIGYVDYSWYDTTPNGPFFEPPFGGSGGGGSPVIIDLNNDGVLELTSAQNGIQYDINEDGVKEQVSWIGADEGFLVFDINNDHVVNNANEFVFTLADPTAKTDMEALRNVFDTNHDGLLTIDDEGWQHFGIWQDINHDG
ncbi:MAG: DUF5801 repeats-in-toxin domain-containing protein, partial [Candidatus Berkiella sp.]